MIHLKLSNYDQALEMGFNYHDDNPDDFKVYELIGDIYFEKESWDDALFYYIRSILNDKDKDFSYMLIRHKYRDTLF